jgi:hypothetical protein
MQVHRRGGLYIKNIEIQNICLLLKSIHNLHTSSTCSWANFFFERKQEGISTTALLLKEYKDCTKLYKDRITKMTAKLSYLPQGSVLPDVYKAGTTLKILSSI